MKNYSVKVGVNTLCEFDVFDDIYNFVATLINDGVSPSIIRVDANNDEAFEKLGLTD